ncbi:MAG: hypothetical protein ABL921_01740 [Pirellula sp.]
MQNQINQPIVASASYQSRIESHTNQIQKYELLMQRLVWVRLGLALPGIGLILFGIAENSAGSWTWQLGILLVFGFLMAATWHENNLWAASLLRQRLSGYKRLLARSQRDWAALHPLATEEASKSFQSELSRDLDLFGDRSLYRWLSLVMTHSGAKTLCEWLTHWESHATIQRRQMAVAELAADRSWRMKFFETACNYQHQDSGPEGIVEWAKSPNHFVNRAWLHGMTWLSPLILILGIACIVFCKVIENDIGQTIGLIAMLSGAALNFLLTMAIIGPIHDIFVQIGASNRELQSLRDMIHRIDALDSKAELLKEIREKCFGGQHSAETALSQLQRIMSLAGMQRSPLMFILYLLLQVSVLWDVRVLELLERWKQRYGRNTSDWLDAIGMMEALCSAAAIADEYPDWCYPELSAKEQSLTSQRPLLSAEDVAHPLLTDAQRVPNSVLVEQTKPLLLVTGSNMAGKSTLLRSVGINAVLARTGGPVCAKSWKSASLELASSIRVQDSLQDGVSFFMAELKRLRAVVDSARSQNVPDGRQMLVLLDEILQGTNSRERQIAVEHVLDRLVEFGCIVLTSTHDLELAGNSRIQNIARVVHFREHFESKDGQQIMRFDYRMYPGVTPTTNALKLLDMVGLRN